jgi:hypothetical protein
MRSIRIATLAAAVLAAPLQAEFKSLWPLDGSLAAINGSSPQRSVEDNLKGSGGNVQLRLDPILGWTGSRWLILPSLALDWQSANSIVKVQDERFEFLQQGTSRLELGAAFRRTPDQRFGIRLFGESFQAKQAVNEEIATGAYNYQDGGLSLDWRQKWATNTPFRSTVGLTATDRKYPNWQSLDPEQRPEKDQGITKLYTDLEWAWTSAEASTILGFSLQSAAYRSGLTIDSEGTTSAGLKRRDDIIDVSLSVPMQFGRHGVHTGLAAQVWDSNLNIFDSQLGTYIPDYNDFFLTRVDLGYAYDFAGPWWVFDSPQVTLDLGLEVRQYTQRPARNSDGSLRDQAERSFIRDFGIGFNSAYTEHWGFFFKVNVQNASSNNHDQSSTLYNYHFNTTALGFNFVY